MKRYKYIAALLIGSLIGFSGCTDNFESDNEIKGAFNDEVKEYDYQKYTMPLEIIHAFGVLKKAAALANWSLGMIDAQRAELIAGVCDELISGKLDEHLGSSTRYVLRLFP